MEKIIQKRWKRCPLCNRWLDRSKFAKNKHQYDGVQTHCTECRQKYRTTPEAKIREKNRKKSYRQRPEVKVQKKRYNQIFLQKNPDYYLVYNTKWKKNNGDKVREQRARRRQLGYIELWPNTFPDDIDVDFHHVYPALPFVIPIPTATHVFVAGSTGGTKHFKFNKKWIEKIYSTDINSLIFPSENRSEEQHILHECRK